MVVVQGADVKCHFAQSTQEGQSARESRTGPPQWRQRGARGGRGVDSDGLENLDLADGGDREPLLFIVHLDFLERDVEFVPLVVLTPRKPNLLARPRRARPRRVGTGRGSKGRARTG